MGANCFAAKDRPLHNKSGHEVSTYRNASRFCYWSSQQAMRGHIEDPREIPVQVSYNSNRNAISEVKAEVDIEGNGFPNEDPSMISQSSKWIKFIGNSRRVKSISLDQPAGNESSPEERGSLKLSVLPSISEKKPLTSIPSASPSTYYKDGPSSSTSEIIHSSEPSSRKPLNKNCPLDRRNSILLSHDYMSFNSQNAISFNSKILESSRNLVTCPSPDLHSCGICSKLLNEKSSRSSFATLPNEISVVAVLVCGHVYHAECLESSTPETKKYDPPCPVCTQKPKLSGKSDLKGRNMVSQIAVADINADGDSSLSSNYNDRTAKDPIMRASSNRMSFIVPFLKRHFSIGSQRVRLVSENEKKGNAFWEKYSKNKIGGFDSTRE
ncbi:hypothetical protein AXF42_Ash012842 [Apostasia shenzhenica]|uniref:RING-type domain-containing protein n=1 Tax=Apostasia shenzhenica TaxID=1088818 RepID=A0A2I0AMD1_9ASPA|nr:hypothetical protein AXF42_Ash012842 [Apostasia shenzhenica]